MLFYRSSLRKNFRLIFSNIVWICVVGYFVFHIIIGARGAISWTKLSKEVVSLEKELENLKEENDFLQNKINLIRGDNLDLDLLEELALNILGFSNENDTVVLLPRGN